MPEKVTKILYGAVLEDMPPCPDPKGWKMWLHAEIHRSGDSFVVQGAGRPTDFDKSDGSIRVLGVPFECPHESSPAWIGFLIDVLLYGDVWMMNDSHDRARKAWNAFDALVCRRTGLQVPGGQLLVAHDE